LSSFRDLPRDTYVGLALGDVDGDGELDIAAASTRSVVVETSRGALLLETPRPLRNAFAVQSDPQVTSGPLVVDVAGDSLPEILVGTDVGLVYALDAGGNVVSGFPRKLLPDLADAALISGDADEDGAPEILGVVGVTANALGPAGGSGLAGWSAPSGDASRRNFAVAGPRITAASRLRARERPLLAYPNPARTGLVRLRITADQPGPYSVAIYNLEGERVFESSGTLRAGTQEIPWSTGGLASGLYVCRFLSAAAGAAKPLIEPITIVR
jgi:hypothetical protein